MVNRINEKEEMGLQNRIEELEKQLETERSVNASLSEHLKTKTELIANQLRDRDNLKETKVSELEEEKNNIMAKKEEAKAEYDLIMQKIEEDNMDRKRREDEEKKEQDNQDAKIADKMAMEDAARYIQRRWEWFQTEGKALAKKGKKKGRGKKGKKKK